jgi:hypothetical protein
MYLGKPISKAGSGLGLTGELLALPDGPEGVRQTLYLMRSLVQRYKTDLGLRSLAAGLVQECNQKDWFCQVRKLHAYVRDRIRYVRDIADVETIQTPDKTLELGYGDCDDKSTLLATLLQTIGHPVRFVAIGTHGADQYSHVYVETLVGTKWVPLETTEPVHAGWEPPNIMAKMIVKI